MTLDPLTDAEYPAFLEEAVPGYAESNVRAGYWSQEDALEKSRKAYDELLPEGNATPGHFLFIARDAETGSRVGTLWIALRPRARGEQQVYIYDIEVDEALRGRGYGRAVMNACADKARELGATSIGLHVFSFNEPAYRLYESLGFQPTSVNMALPL